MEWYFYVNSQQIGPFGKEQFQQMWQSGLLTNEVLVCQLGWKEWLSLEHALEKAPFLTEAPKAPGKQNPETMSPKKRPPRAEIAGRVTVHNNESLEQGTPVNISVAGIFFETDSKPFRIGEKLKLTCSIEGIKGPFQTEAVVVRYSQEPKGCGLAFENLDHLVIQHINTLLEKKTEGK